MTEEQPLAGSPLPSPPPAAEAERFPFWGFADLFLLAGLAMPCMFAGLGIVRLAMSVFRLHTAALAEESVAEMLIGYGLFFSAMMVLFRVQYDRPFWRSLGWTRTSVPFLWNVICGLATGLLVAFIAGLIRTPPTSGPIVEMMQGRTSLILLAIFGTTIAPACEELAFRGFLQPLLVRSLGPVTGIAIASALFGALHFQEYGDSWRFALLVALAGACFGTMRHLTGSTKAAAIMHASFNALSFVSLFGQGKNWIH
jgi:membrane protease YdiL (CAAX protease family)